MTEHPICPPGYDCKFTEIQPHYVGPWYEGVAGTWVALVAIVALTAVLITFTVMAFQSRRRRLSEQRAASDARAREAHELALEEQRTMQADAAKGDPEMLKLIRSGS